MRLTFQRPQAIAYLGIAALVCTTPGRAASAPMLMIGGSAPIGIVSPAGFQYSTPSNGGAALLSANVDGFVLCANMPIGTLAPSDKVRLRPVRDRWMQPEGTDVQQVSYVGGYLSINRGPSGQALETTLTCHVRGAQGESASPFGGNGEMLFRYGMEDRFATQLQSLVNWYVPDNFTWSALDWPTVPNDSCNWDSATTRPIVPESSFCAAATGVRPVAANSQNETRFGDRAATMWTKSTSSHFIYVARIDARFGAHQEPPNSSFPSGNRSAGSHASYVFAGVRDAYDDKYLTAGGQYCFLSELPLTLTDSVCDGPLAYYSRPLVSQSGVSGLLNESFPLSLGFDQSRSFFVAVVRGKTQDFPQINTPVAAIGVFADPMLVQHEGGDEYVGDDVVYAFPEGQMFPWMVAQQ